MLLGLEDIQSAQAQIGGLARVTPVMSSTTVGDQLGVRLHLKAGQPFNVTWHVACRLSTQISVRLKIFAPILFQLLSSVPF